MRMTLYDALREVKDRVTAQEVCDRYGIQVNAQHKARCVWHNDERPSMHVYPGKRGVYCFSCGAGGSVVDLTMAVHGITLRDAVERLARDFGLDIELDGNAGRAEYKPAPVDYKRLYEQELRDHAEDMKDLARLVELVLDGQSEAVEGCVDDIEARLYGMKRGDDGERLGKAVGE